MSNKTLAELYSEHKGKVSDKWSIYLSEYNRIFNDYREEPVKMLEIGVQNGGSLEIWSKYFQRGEKFIGCDINPDCSILKFDDKRISLVVGDANVDSVQAEILEHSSEFNIVIDDGSHLSSDIVESFARYFPKIVDGGVFVAEDLHCSYWQEYEGGLFDPLSSIAFFKSLADVINHEHWGVDKKRIDLFNGFRAKYNFELDDDLLKRVHSIEFINSICVVRKSTAQSVLLGDRFIAGEVENVVKGHNNVHGSTLEPLLQLQNFWSTRELPPGEELPVRLQELSEREGQINNLNIFVEKHKKIASERKREIKQLQSIIDGMQKSFSWRIAEPIRYVGRVYRFIRENGLTIIKLLLTRAGWLKVIIKLKVLVRNFIYRVKYKMDARFGRKIFFKEQSREVPVYGKIIVVSHNANKEGAPLLALNIVKHLRNHFNYDVVTVLASGGDLTAEFKKYSKIYRYDLLSGNEIAELSESLNTQGYNLALCNTSVVGNIVEALQKGGVKCVTLVHELPYVVKVAGLENSLNKIIKYSNAIVFPASYVKNKLGDMFEFNGDTTHVRHQGRYMTNPYLFEKSEARSRLRQHLNCSVDKKLVIGVGSGEYRKGIDLFVETGIKVRSITDNVLFVWVGNCKAPEFEEVKIRIKQTGNKDAFKFINYEEDIGLYYSGADLFFLSSREDPFPSVYIDAITAGLPVIAFDDTGGFIEFQRKIDGVLVDDFNVELAADKINELLCDEKLYQKFENTALRAAQEFGFNSYLYDLLEISGTVLPKVSVIVPNYNYEQYIEGRLISIFQQTVKPYEIIFLDDNSKDSSLAIAQRLLEDSGFDYSIVANSENKGCYKQWLKGISKAKGDFIWIAEADDLCRQDFIEKLLPKFDGGTNIVYSQSVAIDENSNEMNFSYLEYTRELSETRWCNDFANNGENEIVDYLVKMNTIPNASGVILRKSALDGVEEYLKDFTSTGDWLTYVYALSSGGISFVSEPLNYHRRHSGSIIHTVMHDPKLLKEIILVSRYIVRNYKISDENKRLLAKRFNDYYGLILSGESSLSEDKMFKSFFHDNDLDDLWGYVLDI